jgi:dipeptidyl aminopeptidase/acylaminoacyl peptidase
MSVMPRTGVGGIELTGTDELLVSGDVQLPLMVYRPETNLRVPAVVVCSGGIGTGMFEVMEWIGRSLQRAGILAVTISWRGSSPEFDVDDASLAADWLASQNDVDPNRIAIFGISRGANAALRAGALDPRFKLVVTLGAVTNFLQMIEGLAHYAPGRRKLLVNWLGDPETHRDFYERVQAINFADRIKCPVLMVHGQHDMHAPPEQSIWMCEAIKNAGNSNVQLHTVPMMGHYGDMVPNTYGFNLLSEIIVPYIQKNL